MHLQDIRDGMILKLRNGELKLVRTQEGRRIVQDFNLAGFNFLDRYNEDLTGGQDLIGERWDIMKVYLGSLSPYTFKEERVRPLWVRPETVEMTLEEICEALGKDVKIIKTIDRYKI